MAYGVIVYESEHESLLSLPPEDVGNIIQNMIRTFKGEEVELLANKCVNAYSMSLCNRVNADKGKVVAGSKGGAPKGNNNASKTSKTTTQNKQNNQKQPNETSKTTSNNNYNYNNNNNIGFKPNAFTSGCTNTDYDFEEIERNLIKN